MSGLALRDRDPFKVGLVAVGVGAVLALVVLVVTVIPFGQRSYVAYFDQSANLRPKEPVQVHGVRVGEVRSVELDGQRVKVNFSVSRDVHLGSATTADIKVMTLLGSHFLQVSPLGGGDLADGVIPQSRTTVPFNLQDALDVGVAKVGRLDGPALAKMLSTMADEMAPAGDQLVPALQGVVRLSGLVTSRGDQIGDLLTAARGVTTQLSASSTDLLALMRQANLVITEVTARREAIHTLLTEATRLSRNVVGLIGDTRADVGPMLTSLDRALGELRRQDKQLRGVLEAMAPSVRYVANATGNGPYALLNVYTPALPPNDAGCLLSPGGCK